MIEVTVTPHISNWVFDQDTGFPIKDAKVYFIEASDKFVLTQYDGSFDLERTTIHVSRFFLKIKPPGGHLIIQVPGYETTEIKVTQFDFLFYSGDLVIMIKRGKGQTVFDAKEITTKAGDVINLNIEKPKTTGYTEDHGWIFPDLQINETYHLGDINDFMLSVFEGYVTGNEEFIRILTMPGVPTRMYNAFKGLELYKLDKISSVHPEEIPELIFNKINQELIKKSKFYEVEISIKKSKFDEDKSTKVLIAETGPRFYLLY